MSDHLWFDQNKIKFKKLHLEDAISKEQRRLRFDMEVHKRDQSNIREHINDINEFWRNQSLKKTQIEKNLDIWPPDEGREENINNLKFFREWKGLGNEQQRIVDDIMEQFESNPHRWTINFEEINNKSRKQFVPSTERVLRRTHGEHTHNRVVQDPVQSEW